MRRLLDKKAQSTLEYAVLIAVVVGAVIGMQTYVKRGLQGRLQAATDDVGTQFEPALTTVEQDVKHGTYTSYYDVESDGKVIRDEKGKVLTYEKDLTTTPWSATAEE